MLHQLNTKYKIFKNTTEYVYYKQIVIIVLSDWFICVGADWNEKKKIKKSWSKQFKYEIYETTLQLYWGYFSAILKCTGAIGDI